MGQYKACAIDADGDIWGQRQDGIWVLMNDARRQPAEENIHNVSAKFGPVATAALIPVEE